MDLLAIIARNIRDISLGVYGCCAHHRDVLVAWRRLCPHEPHEEFVERVESLQRQCPDCRLFPIP